MLWVGDFQVATGGGFLGGHRGQLITLLESPAIDNTSDGIPF